MGITQRSNPRTITLVVAASNSSIRSKKSVDYLCNGTNDHIKIQAAIDALPATGGEVRLLEGTYNIETVISLDSNQTFRGTGKNTILTTTSAITMIQASGGSGTEKVNVTVSDLQIDGNSISLSGVKYSYADYSIIKNVNVNNIDQWSSIYLTNSDFCLVDASFSSTSGTKGIHAYTCTNSIISNNNVQGSTNSGIRLENSNTLSVFGNISSSNTQHGILASGGSDNNINNNKCHSNSDSGIFVSGGANNTINNNVCEGNTERGIFVLTSTENTVVGNNCVDNGFSNIQLENVSSKNIVNGNICTGSTGSNGIFLEVGGGTGSIDCVITNNYCQGNANYGIRLYAVLNSNISGNICQENDYDGISVENESHNNNISNNILLANGQGTDDTYDGINVKTSNYNLISGNTCLDGSGGTQPKYGIHITSTGTPTGNVVEGNNLYNSGKTAAFLDSGTDTLSRNNIDTDATWIDNIVTIPDIIAYSTAL